MPGDALARSYTSAIGGPTQPGRDKFVARTLLQSARYQEMDRRQSYYDCTQHNQKKYDFDGRMIPAGGFNNSVLSAEVTPYYVPQRARRPSAPYRLGKSITDAFTNLLFGENRFPKVTVAGDGDTEDFQAALMKEAKFESKFIQARNLGGSMGTVGISWCFRNGKPRLTVHNAKHLFVHEWEDREQLVPAHVTECYQYEVQEWDSERRGYVVNRYWYRRDWLKDVEVPFIPVRVRQDSREPEWAAHIDVDNVVEHNDGMTHFHWVQNIPSSDVDGLPDYHGLYDEMDALDILSSVLHKATTLNLDPTVVLKMDADIVQRMGIKKGSDNALVVGEEGDASYMEITGSGIEAGIKLFEIRRRTSLETAQCVIPDPHEIAASGTSSVAMKVIYQPMLAQSAIHRSQYGTPMMKILDEMTAVARKYEGQVVPYISDDKDQPEGAGPQEGNMVLVVDLPTRTVENAVLDEMGVATGEKQTQKVERAPGPGGLQDLEWPDWFPLTPTDKTAVVTALSTAAGGKAIMSPQSASEELARAFGRDPAEEWQRMQALQKADDAKAQAQAEALNEGAGGQVPPGGKGGGAGGTPKPNFPPGPGDLDVDLSDFDDK